MIGPITAAKFKIRHEQSYQDGLAEGARQEREKIVEHLRSVYGEVEIADEVERWFSEPPTLPRLPSAAPGSNDDLEKTVDP